MKLQVKSRKAKAKGNGKTKGKKTGKNNSKKSRKSTRRIRQLRGGMNDLGAIFMKIVENKKKIDIDEKKEQHAQSDARQDLDEEKDNLKQELRTALKNDEEKISTILGFVDEYIQKQRSMVEEEKNNRD
jgi:hypothetical protein